MVQLSVSLLGTFQLSINNQLVDRFRTKKVQALLICLLVNAAEQRESSIPREQITELLWPYLPPESGRDNLRATLYQLRRAIPKVAGLQGQTVPFVLNNRRNLRINPDALYELDVARFVELLTFHDPIQWADAVELYRDDFLIDFYLTDNSEFDLWIETRRAKLRGEMQLVLRRLTAACLDQGAFARAEKYARRQLALDDFDENAHRQLLIALALSGRRAAALSHYDALRALLVEAFGVEPSKKTKELSEAISRAEVETWLQTNGGKTALDNGELRNAPSSTTRFIGRENELRELERFLSERQRRLVSIVGPGGSGKTRLAMELAVRMASRYTRGATFVPLAPLSRAAAIPAAIATAIGLRLSDNGKEQEQLLSYLANKEVLLVLDNFEHLLEGSQTQQPGAQALLRDILVCAPLVQVIVTSREVLRLSDEQLFPIDGLPFPEDNREEDLTKYDAVKLFVDRARRIQPFFSPQDQQAGLRSLCRLLAGIPLAVEIAATWIHMLDCAGIAAEIQRRLDFLTIRLHDVPERHRSMQIVFDHSWSLLSEKEQRVLRQLSVFRAPYRLEAAVQVTKATATELSILVDKSLLYRRADGRYYLHELLRQYAAEKLQQSIEEVETTQTRFVTYYVNFLEQRRVVMQGPEQQKVLAEIAAELDNIRVAWEWMLAPGRGKELQSAFSTYVYFHFYQSRFEEAATAAAHAASVIRGIPELSTRDLALAQALNQLGFCQIRLGQFDEARTGLEASIAIHNRLDHPPPLGIGSDSLLPLAIVELIQGTPARALELAEQARTAATRRDDSLNLMLSHYVLSSAHAASGLYEAAYTEAQRACMVGRRVANDWFLGYALLQLGRTARATGCYAEARQHYEASAAIRRRLNYKEGVAEALSLMGDAALVDVDYDAALPLFQEALALYQETNDRGGIAGAHHGIAQVALAKMEGELARHHLATALRVATDIQFLPLVLAIVVDIGRLLLITGELSRGIELLALVQHHNAAEHATKLNAEEQLTVWQPRVVARLFSESVTRGKETDLETVLMSVFRILSTPGSH